MEASEGERGVSGFFWVQQQLPGLVMHPLVYRLYYCRKRGQMEGSVITLQFAMTGDSLGTLAAKNVSHCACAEFIVSF